MNKSNLIHAAIAFALQIVVVITGTPLLPAGYVYLAWYAGALPGSWFYIGREHAQYEVRKQRGEPSWTTDAILDVVCPVALVVTLAYLSRSFT